MFRTMKMTILSAKAAVAQCRYLATLAPKPKKMIEDKMCAWQIHSYGSVDEITLSNCARTPIISKPDEVIIKVDASSVNPIDNMIAGGYGAKVLSLMRKTTFFTPSFTESDIEFPLTLGRDFTGTIVSKGHGVKNNLKIGDEVWGVVPVEKQGCHATYVVVNDSLVNHRPKNISYIEGASILYAGLTAWSALWITGGMCYETRQPEKNILVLGGSGGVGTIAIQLLKAWNMRVTTTCSSDAVNLLEKLGADVVIDYKQGNADQQIIDRGPYHIILDCCNQGPDQIHFKEYPHSTYVGLNSPILKNIDSLGVLTGTAKSVADLLKYNMPFNEKKRNVKWGFFTPSETGISMLQDLVEKKKITPVVQKVYSFKELSQAYEQMAKGHSRGKLVIDMR